MWYVYVGVNCAYMCGQGQARVSSSVSLHLTSKIGSSTEFGLRDSARLLVSDFPIPGNKHIPLYPALYVGVNDVNSGLKFMQQAIYPLNFLPGLFLFSVYK